MRVWVFWYVTSLPQWLTTSRRIVLPFSLGLAKLSKMTETHCIETSESSFNDIASQLTKSQFSATLLRRSQIPQAHARMPE